MAADWLVFGWVRQYLQKGAIMNDMVNSPSHYNQSGIECIDAIEAATGLGEGFEYYL